MTVAEAARAAVDDRPFLHEALRAGVCNYAAAAAALDVDGDDDAVATALRRYAEDLGQRSVDSRDARVTMRSGVGVADDGDDVTPGDALLSVGGTAIVDGAGDATAVLATGDVDGDALLSVLGRLRTGGVDVEVAAVAGDAITVVVGRRDGAQAVRLTEAALERVPE